jgi:hypothetical protein
MLKNPSNLNGLLGSAFGGGIDPNNINDLAFRFKSPPNHMHNLIRTKNPTGSMKLRGVDISWHSIREVSFWHSLVVRDA